MTLRPTPSEERWLTLARRLRRSPRVAPFSGHTGGWRTASLLSRCTFFVLGLIAAGMIAIITERLGPQGSLVTAGLVSIAVAEWLIVARRHFWSGIEEALEVAGLTMLAFECWNRGGWSESVGVGLVGAALASAGLRLLNPLFTTLSALALVLALDAPPIGAGLVCYGIGLAALFGSGYSFRRPSNDLTLDWLIVVMPVAGYVWSATRSVATDYLHAGASAWLVPICPLIFAAIALATSLWRRAHAPLVASMLCVACTAYELRRLTGLSLETRLVVWGCAMLLVSIVLERYLRQARSGITSRQMRDEGDSAGILGIAGSAVLTPHSPSKAAPSFEGAGGRFGGGGATGQY
jgi:uncharacterized membrane protein YgcG